MMILFVIISFVIIITIIFLRQPKLGRLPSGKRLEQIKKSPNYKNGAFQNISLTPALAEGTSYFKVMKEFFFDKKPRLKPAGIVPSVKTDLIHLDINKNVLVWFGHSSYFIQTEGKRILVDPVFSGAASPFSFSIKAFKGTDVYTPDDMPAIDLLIITHDHWDHLDYDTVKRLRPKVRKVVCGLGTGAHLERWGYDKNIIIEKDWNEKIELQDDFTIFTVPARHFSGRGLSRNKTLWMSFILQTPKRQIFIGGDSGYDKHFAETGKTFGTFDLAIIENGQYNESWRYIHLLPVEVLQTAKELHAKRVLPVHSGKFPLALHAWDEPFKLITANSKKENVEVITPMIGEVVNLDDAQQAFSHWWKSVD
ncbi:MAG TPA: MBL fold metallo-hydrolase [Parafilimonas sp.]|nr:MBL fold metallo-hydrolase [Parafilimonas sp.]